MKKTMYGLFFGVLTLFGVAIIAPALAQNAGSNDNWNANGGFNQQATPGINVPGSEQLQGDKLINSAKTFINWVLGMLSLIALVICLYAGFMMVTSAGDEKKYEKGMDILKKAGIGLVIIGLARLIVSVVFWLIGNLTS
jgi:hypothetical protein